MTDHHLHHFEAAELGDRIGRRAAAGLRADLDLDDGGLPRVLSDVVDEIVRALAAHGDQTHVPSYTKAPRVATGAAARDDCAAAFATGQGSWAHILVEEVAEAVDDAADANPGALRAELVQVAAMAIQWIRKLDIDARPANRATPERYLAEDAAVVVDLRTGGRHHLHVDPTVTP